MRSHVIFDLDGTLVDTAPLCAAILNDMLGERGSDRRVSAADTRRFLTRGGQQIVAALLAEECGDIDLELAEFRRRYQARPTPQESLFPGVFDGLRELSRLGVRTAICSNKPQVLCDKTVDELGLSSLLHAVVGSRVGMPLKPAVELVHVALAELGAGAEQCLFVGDSEVDWLTAAAVGMPFLFVSYGYAEPGWSAAGVPTAACFADLLPLVLERQALVAELPRVA